MSSFGYIRATGDPDYNFAYNDFTVEIFAETSNAIASPQILFEISNNESSAANLFSKTRFFTVLENGNLNAYATQDSAIVYVPANTSSFLSPVPINANYRVFYNGQLLESNQYTVSGSNVSLSNITISTSNTRAAVSEILFQIQGGFFSANTMHFVSAERYQNEFYLFLDGQSQASSVPAFNAIPTQILANTANANSNVNRMDSPALLTIGANQDGQDPFFGLFGDIRITNGNARHVPYIKPVDSVVSNFPDPFLGTHYSDITVNGGNFVDSTTSYGPEELVNGQMFDTLFIQTYQSSTSNANANILSFIFFKPMILSGPIGSYTFTLGNVTSGIPVPWTSLDQAAASVLVNGNALPCLQWLVANNQITVNATPGSTIEIISTGPTNYYAVGNANVSTITTNLYSTDTSINVANATHFDVPTGNQRGQVFVNQECITYLYVHTGNNTISGLTRGYAGTGVSNIHVSGSRIICAGFNEDLQNLTNVDPRSKVWYTTPFNNTSLQNTGTAIANELITYGGISPLSVF